MADPAPPPRPAVLRVTGLVLVGLGVLLYVVFGLAKGAAMDAGPWTLLVVPVVFGAGCLLLARRRDGDAMNAA